MTRRGARTRDWKSHAARLHPVRSMKPVAILTLKGNLMLPRYLSVLIRRRFIKTYNGDKKGGEAEDLGINVAFAYSNNRLVLLGVSQSLAGER